MKKKTTTSDVLNAKVKDWFDTKSTRPKEFKLSECSCGHIIKQGDFLEQPVTGVLVCPKCNKRLFDGEAKKFDEEKTMWAYSPWRALEEVAKVMTFGAKKYEPRNYLQGEGLSDDRYFSAMMRHVTAHLRGETIDPESGLPHLSHAACCLLMWQETIIYKDLETWKFAK